MNDTQLEYLRLNDSLAKTNSPNDQPAFDDMSSLFKILKDCIPPNGKMNEITVSQYEKILLVVQKELDSTAHDF